MQAFILAGGLGTRLRPLTQKIPKAMVPVCGRPYLEYQIELMAARGVVDIVCGIGHLGEQIRDYFQDGQRWGVKIRYSQESQPLGTGGALRNARPLLGDMFFVVNGDTYLAFDYAAAEKFFVSSCARALIAVYDNTASDIPVRPNISVDSSGFVDGYRKDAGAPYRFVDTGILLMRKGILSEFPDKSPLSLENNVYPILIGKRLLTAWPVTEKFYDIGTAERKGLFEQYVRTHR